jgi:hypothetical protein
LGRWTLDDDRGPPSLRKGDRPLRRDRDPCAKIREHWPRSASPSQGRVTKAGGRLKTAADFWTCTGGSSPCAPFSRRG